MVCGGRQAWKDRSPGGEGHAAEPGGADLDGSNGRRRISGHQLRPGILRRDGVQMAACRRGRVRAGYPLRGAWADRGHSVQVPCRRREQGRTWTVLRVSAIGQSQRTSRYVASSRFTVLHLHYTAFLFPV